MKDGLIIIAAAGLLLAGGCSGSSKAKYEIGFSNTVSDACTWFPGLTQSNLPIVAAEKFLEEHKNSGGELKRLVILNEVKRGSKKELALYSIWCLDEDKLFYIDRGVRMTNAISCISIQTLTHRLTNNLARAATGKPADTTPPQS